MKLAVLGGSYNPIHIGHLMLADAVAFQYGYDTIAFVPAFLSPFKTGHAGCTTADRLAMVECAIAGNSTFYCESCELQRQGVSYTIDTLIFLKKKYPQCESKIGLIIGDDLLSGLSRWHQAKHIPEYADILVGSRVGNTHTAALTPFPYIRVNNALLPISSSAIRAAIKNKKSWRYLVPPAVYSYIKAHKLYE